MPLIDIKQEDLEILRTLSEKLKTQDNLCTEDPVYVVYQKRQIVVNSDYNSGVETFYMDPENIEHGFFDDAEKYVAERIESGYEINEDEIEEVDVIEIDVFVKAFFTMDAAQSFIKKYHYNYYKPFVFVESGYRNWEWTDLRKILMGTTW